MRRRGCKRLWSEEGHYPLYQVSKSMVCKESEEMNRKIDPLGSRPTHGFHSLF